MEHKKHSLLVVSGFGDKGISEFADTLSRTDAFSQTKIMRGCPWWHAGTSPRRRVSAIEEQLARMEQPVMLVGHSYGALLALGAACRRQLSEICGVFINGPLNPYVFVPPPQDKPLFRLFGLHYQMREEIAAECMDMLRKVDDAVLKNCVTVASPNDGIVPPDAQKLPGILSSITLPREIHGHGMSPEKIAAVSKIVADMIPLTFSL